MASLTRWVLAHKRIVVVSWIVLTIAGIAAAGPASDALDQEFSVPNKEGWETNVSRSPQQYGGTGGDSAPLAAGRDAARRARPSIRPACASDLAAIDARLSEALPGARIASYASTGDRAFVSKDGRRRSRSPIRGRTPTRLRREPGGREAGPARRSQGVDGGRARRCI